MTPLPGPEGSSSQEPSRQTEKAQPQARPAHRIVLPNREPRMHPKGLRSAPSGSQELPIPAAHRRPWSDGAKTLVFDLTYNDRPATIAVTLNERGQLVNAFVGGALAAVVSRQVLLLEKSSGFPSDNRPRESKEGSAVVNSLSDNLAEMKDAASAVAKTVLESLDFRW